MLTSATLSAKPAAVWLRRLGPVLVALPIGCYVVLVLTYAVNVPWVDDMDAFLSFILGYSDAKTLADKLDWLLRPNNEHRILTAKLTTLAMRFLTGEVNFRWLIFVALAFLAGTFALFYRVFRSMSLPLLAFAPVCFIFWQPQYYLTSLWALTGLQHEVVVFLTLLAIYLLSGKGRYRFAGAMALQILASLSMSNGLFGWVAGAVVLALASHWRRLGLWVALGVATILFYFHDFQNSQGNGSSVSFFLASPHIVVAAFFTFIGSLFDFVPVNDIFRRSILPTLFGLVLVPTVIWFLWRMNWPLWSRQRLADPALQQRRYFFTGSYAFLFINAAIVAFLRPRFGYGVMLVSNYMIYPALLTSLVYLNGLSEFRPRLVLTRWLWTGLGLGLIVWTISYGLHWPQIALRRQMLLTFSFNQKHNDIGLGPNWGSAFAGMVRQVMRETVARGIYHYPTGYFTPYEALLRPSSTTPVDPKLALHMRGGGYDYIVETDVNALPNPVGQAAVVVQSAERTFLFPSESGFRPSAFYTGRPVRTIWAEIVNPMLAPGTYRIGLLTPPAHAVAATDTSSAQTPVVRFSNRQITIP
jgi:hypothetical protein